jgi:hypothetical protein
MREGVAGANAITVHGEVSLVICVCECIYIYVCMSVCLRVQIGQLVQFIRE